MKDTYVLLVTILVLTGLVVLAVPMKLPTLNLVLLVGVLSWLYVRLNDHRL